MEKFAYSGFWGRSGAIASNLDEKPGRASVDEENENEHAAPGQQPVPDERVKGAALHETEQKEDAEITEEGGSGDADQHRGHVIGRDPVLDQMPKL